MLMSPTSPVLAEFTKIINEIPFNRILGLKINVLDGDHIMMSFDMTPDLVGNFMHGILHGGVISAVLDMAGGTAAMHSAIQKREGKSIDELASILAKASTISMNVDYLQPGKGLHFVAKAWVQHSGNKITFTRMELRNQDNVLIAAGNATYMVG